MALVRRIARQAWWWIRGVKARDYRRVCARCDRTGQAHWALTDCRRFRRTA